MLYLTSPRLNGGQPTRRANSHSPFLEAFADANSRPSVNNDQAWYEPEEKPTRFHPVSKQRSLPSTKPRHTEGVPVLPLEPPPMTAGHPKRAPRPPPCPRPRSPARPPSRLQYADGLPILPNTAARAKQPPVYFRDHTRGRCIHCALTASPCTFTIGTPSTPCGRCRRLGQVCMIRRPGTARRIVRGDEAGDWVPVQRAVEEAVGEDGARALAERAMQESEEEGTRTVFGERFRAKDIRGWCLPRVVGGGEGGEGFWRRVLKGERGEELKEIEEKDGSSLSEAAAKSEEESEF